MTFRKRFSYWFCLAMLTGGAGLCFARYTVINDAVSGSEPDLYQVLDVVAPVSGGWGGTEALNSNLGGLRVGDEADQLWGGGTYEVTVLSAFWGGAAVPADTAGQYFRYGAPDGSAATPWTTVNSPGDTGSFTHDGPFIIGDGGGIYGGWSSEALNSGPLADRAVTFDVTGLDIFVWTAGDVNNPVTLLKSAGLGPSYIVGFEVGSDGDYQDMLFLIRSVNPIPAPAAIVLSGIGVAFAGWLKQKRFIK